MRAPRDSGRENNARSFGSTPTLQVKSVPNLGGSGPAEGGPGENKRKERKKKEKKIKIVIMIVNMIMSRFTITIKFIFIYSKN